MYSSSRDYDYIDGIKGDAKELIDISPVGDDDDDGEYRPLGYYDQMKVVMDDL